MERSRNIDIIRAFDSSPPAGSCQFGMNIAGTCRSFDTPVTQPRNVAFTQRSGSNRPPAPSPTDGQCHRGHAIGADGASKPVPSAQHSTETRADRGHAYSHLGKDCERETNGIETMLKASPSPLMRTACEHAGDALIIAIDAVDSVPWRGSSSNRTPGISRRVHVGGRRRVSGADHQGCRRCVYRAHGTRRAGPQPFTSRILSSPVADRTPREIAGRLTARSPEARSWRGHRAQLGSAENRI